VLLKGEGQPSQSQQRRSTEGKLAIQWPWQFRLPDNLRAGCAVIQPPDTFDFQLRIFVSCAAGMCKTTRPNPFTAVHPPAIVFIMQSLETLTYCGKRIAAMRLKLVVYDREPGMKPESLGCTCQALPMARGLWRVGLDSVSDLPIIRNIPVRVGAAQPCNSDRPHIFC
jgi:4-hydroxy-tetrahydrodipicolinate synthase